MQRPTPRHFLTSLVVCAGLTTVGAVLTAAAPATRRPVYPPAANPCGQSYAAWSVNFWQWALSHPLTGHPFIDSPSFDIASGQTGPVWFLASVVDGSQALTTTVRNGSVPRGKSLYVALLNSEWSDLEGYVTEQEQRDNANWFGDHIVNLTCTIDGVAVDGLDHYRVETPQFSFTAPTPWIFGPVGGVGHAVADGYCVMLPPMSVGQHTINITGGFHFSIAEGDPFDFDTAIDMTYNLAVVP